MEFDIYRQKKVAELREIARVLGIKDADKLKKKEILDLFLKMHEEAEGKEAPSEKAESVSEEVKPAPKRRGRPPKKKPETEALAVSEENSAALTEDAGPASSESSGSAELPKPESFGSAEKQPSCESDGVENRQSESSSDAENQATETASGEEPGPSGEAEENAENKPSEESSDSGAPQVQETASDADTQQKYDNRYETTGVLEVTDNGYGFLRFDNFLSSEKDIYVPQAQINRFRLKTGDEIQGVARKKNGDEKFGALLYVRTVNGEPPITAKYRKDFSNLTPVYPQERIFLEKGSSTLSMRLTDLVAPIGKGQRGIIVAPPKAGKTTILKQIAKSIEAQNLDAELIVLLIDERPEEVTDMKESINGTVIYSTFDELPANHVKVAEMVLERAQRLCEHGKDVIILMDSITRLARAYNLVEPASGRTLSGGLDPAALYKPKKFFGAARNTREGGSITILATALIETGSRMDDMIFEEFKGTGNMELHLDRRLQEKRIFPAININKTGTRREDMLMSSEELEAVWMMRRAVSDWGVEDATEKIVFDLVHTKNNGEFIQRFLKTRL